MLALYKGRSFELEFDMFLLRGLISLFLLPGTLVINRIGINVEEDGGILRSLINMIFWGIVVFLLMLPFLVAK